MAAPKLKNLEPWQSQPEKQPCRVITVKTVKTVEPPNYRADMQRLKKLESDYNKLLAIVKYGNISTVSSLIDEYKNISKKYLINLTRELQYYFASAEERQELIEFILYLQYTEKELKKFLLDDSDEI